MELNKIYEHNVLNPWPLPDKSIDSIITSPPYRGLRDYKIEGQLGLEKSPEEFIDNMLKVFREAHRVLKDDGTLWVNIGDTYYGGKGMNGASTGYPQHSNAINAKALITTEPGQIRPQDRPHVFLKPKDLCGIPWMLAFALRADGWYLRQDIIWHKPNPMPESCQDRCTKSHEYIFLFSKSNRYYFDALSIATPYAEKTYTTFGTQPTGYGDGSGLIASEGWHERVPVRKPKEWKVPDGWDQGEGTHGKFHREGRGDSKKKDSKVAGNPDTESAANLGKYRDDQRKSGNKERKPATERGTPEGTGKNQAGSIPWVGDRANKRSVWTVPTSPFKDAHFATFPPDLIVDCIKAGCRGGGVLDPFMGAGTTAVVARKLERNFVGLEINPKYITIANDRLRNELGMFL